MADTPRPSTTTPWWLWPNLLSLDAPVVAVTWLLLYQQNYRLYALPSNIFWLLFVAVWCIYASDRLLEYNNPDNQSKHHQELRHRTHLKLRKALIPLILILSILSIYTAVTTLTAVFILCVGYLVTLVLAYFAHRILTSQRAIPILPKEIFCGIIFAMGVALAPRVYSTNNSGSYPFEQAVRNFLSDPVSAFTTLGQAVNSLGQDKLVSDQTPNIFIGFIHFLQLSLHYDVIPVAILFSLNCIAISCWEHRTGSNSGANDPTAITTILPELRSLLSPMLILYSLGVLTMLLYWGHIHTSPTYLACLLAGLALFACNQQRHRLNRRQLRVLADVAMLTPLLIIPFVR